MKLIYERWGVMVSTPFGESLSKSNNTPAIFESPERATHCLNFYHCGNGYVVPLKVTIEEGTPEQVKQIDRQIEELRETRDRLAKR